MALRLPPCAERRVAESDGGRALCAVCAAMADTARCALWSFGDMCRKFVLSTVPYALPHNRAVFAAFYELLLATPASPCDAKRAARMGLAWLDVAESGAPERLLELPPDDMRDVLADMMVLSLQWWPDYEEKVLAAVGAARARGLLCEDDRAASLDEL